MHNSRLILLLKSLSPGEMRQFLLFVESPVVNQQPRLLKFAQLLHRAYPGFSDPLLEKTSVHAWVYGEDTPFQAQALYDLSAQMLRLLEQFLAYEQFKSEPGATDLSLLRALSSHSAGAHFDRVYQRLLDTSMAGYDTHAAYYRFQAHQLADTLTSRLQNRGQHDHLARAADHLDMFYIASRLRISCELLNRHYIIKTGFDTGPTDALIVWLASADPALVNTPLIAIYVQVYRMLRWQEESVYQHLAQLLDAHATAFSRQEAYSLFAYAQNYCIKRINEGKQPYLEELFRLYQQLLDTGILLEEGMLAHEHYKNITTVALRLSRFEWVQTFLAQYKSRLHPDVQENAWTYNQSVLYFEQKQYREALKLLQQVVFTDIYYHLSAKSILLKVYYELQEDESLEYLIHAFRALLRRNQQISGFHTASHLNLIRFTVHLMRLREQKNKRKPAEWEARRDELSARLMAAKGVSNADWLRKKLAAL
ncbi:MAG: hypothetical protein SF053_21250 [Bacteroidia bacterium]|nr:hypothetical protein [Bacteroidia bacterium]